MMNKLKLRQQAAHFVTRLHSGEITAGEESELYQWRQAHPQHEHEFQEMLSTWDLAAQLYCPAEQPAQGRWKKGWAVVAMAASIVLTASVVLLQLPSQTPVSEPLVVERPQVIEQPARELPAYEFRMTEVSQATTSEPQDYHSTIGEVRHIRLDDGSTISLNTDTHVRVAYSGEQRSVNLIHGEAFFSVAPDPARPFVIDTDEQVIRVLGTRFNVRKRDDEAMLQVAVVEGQVSVKHNRRSEEPEAPHPEEADENLLVAGDIGAFSDEGQLVSQNETSQVTNTQSWRHGVFRFDNESLEYVVREFNRYRNRKIHIVDSDANDLRISGVFQLKSDASILSALESSLPIRIVRDADYVFIYQR